MRTNSLIESLAAQLVTELRSETTRLSAAACHASGISADVLLVSAVEHDRQAKQIAETFNVNLS